MSTAKVCLIPIPSRGENLVYAAITHKQYRLVPSENGLLLKKNQQALQDAASISQAVALRIADLGHDIEHHYGMPMDVEFVYDPAQDMIAIVQARPIPACASKVISPSSVPPAKIPALKAAIKTGQIQKLNTQVITPAGFAAKTIIHPSQILLCNNISEALTQYLNQNHSSIEVVIVQQMAPATAHEAAQFNLLGIPVLQLDDLSSVQEWLKAENALLLVDPQRDQLLNCTKIIREPHQARQELIEQGWLEEGLFTCPVAPLTSQAFFVKKNAARLSPTPSALGDLVQQDTSAALQLLFSKINPALPLATNIYTQLHNHIEALEAVVVNASNEQAVTALNSTRSIIYRLAKKLNGQVTFLQQAMVLCEEIERSIIRTSQAPADADVIAVRTEHLSLISQLKSLVSFPGNSNTFSNSIKQIMQEKKSRLSVDAHCLLGLDAEQSDFLTQFLKLNKIAFNQTSKQRWTRFVLDCIKDKSSIQRLAAVVKFHVENQLESDLMNHDLEQAMQSEPSSQAVLQKLHDNCLQAKKDFSTIQLEEKRNIIQAWEQRIPEWRHPEKFNALLQEYEKDLLPLVTQLSFIEPLDLVVMPVLPRPEAFSEIQGMANNALVVAQGSVYFVNKKTLNYVQVSDKLKSNFLEYFDIDPTIMQHRTLSVKDQLSLSNMYVNFKRARWSFFYPSCPLTPGEILAVIKTDFAYVLSGDTLYFVNKNSNTCTVSKIEDDDLSDAKDELTYNCAEHREQPIEFIKHQFIDTDPSVWGKDSYINVPYNLTTQKTILNLVLLLTELMDKSIKSLKSSPDYSSDQHALLTERFILLLKPYYQLMLHWLVPVPDYQFDSWYSGTQSYETATSLKIKMANNIKAILDRPHPKQRELAPSGLFSVASAKIGSGANFGRQFIEKKQQITCEDVFSLIHQNLLTAVATVSNEISKTAITSLPDALQPLLLAFERKSRGITDLDLLSITHHFPIVTLEYNLAMANHSAVFVIDYNQQTEQVTINAQVFGGNWQNRMSTLIDVITIDALIYGVQVKKTPVFSESTLSLDFVWELPAILLQKKLSSELHQSFKSYNELMCISGGHNSSRLVKNRYHGIKVLELLVAQGCLDQIKKIGSCWRNLDSSLIITQPHFANLAALLNAHNDPEDVAFIIEKITSSNDANTVQSFIKLIHIPLMALAADALSEEKANHADECPPLPDEVAREESKTTTAEVIDSVMHPPPTDLLKATTPLPQQNETSLGIQVPKQATGIDRAVFERIIETYESTSFLSGCCFFSPIRSVSIRNLKKILTDSSTPIITKEQIETALSADSQRRLHLFQGEGNKNTTSTDEVIMSLKEQF
ncbi:MAG: PEP/pyruvate-binding domain-containing protein [Legionellales bacterium]